MTCTLKPRLLSVVRDFKRVTTAQVGEILNRNDLNSIHKSLSRCEDQGLIVRSTVRIRRRKDGRPFPVCHWELTDAGARRLFYFMTRSEEEDSDE